MNNKYFTLEEANSTIPYVSLIINDIVYKRKRMIELKKAIRYTQDRVVDISYFKDLQFDLKAISEEISHHLEELEQVGCYLKDFELGLVDFPSVINNKVVFLLYQYGESEINYWHNLTEGVESRKLIDLPKNLSKLSIFN